MVFLPERYRFLDPEEFFDQYNTCVIYTLESIATHIVGFPIIADHSIKKVRLNQLSKQDPHLRQEIALEFLPEGIVRRFSEYVRFRLNPSKLLPRALQLEADSIRELIYQAIERGDDLGKALGLAEIHFLQGNFSYAQYLALEGWQVGVVAQLSRDARELHMFHLGFKDGLPVSLSDRGEYGDYMNDFIASGGMHESVDRIRTISEDWNILLVG